MENDSHLNRGLKLTRFWRSAGGFWTGRSAWRIWLLTGALATIVIAQLFTQYRLNYWNRDFFNALEQKDNAAFLLSILQFFPLIALSTALAVTSVWARMRAQRQWRLYLTEHLVRNWLWHGRYRLLGQLNGSDTPQNSEYRIAEDARVATDAPIDLALALLSSLLTAFLFFGVLSEVGGSISFRVNNTILTIPYYLAIAVVIYSSAVTIVILLVGSRLTSVVQDQMQAEATFRAAANLIREAGEGLVVTESETEERKALWIGLRGVIEQWRRLCNELMRTTSVTHANSLLAPTVGLLLCAPKYLAGDMSLGEVTQAAAAFAMVQAAFNWFVDNFQRMSDWRSAACRVAALLLALDDLERSETISTKSA